MVKSRRTYIYIFLALLLLCPKVYASESITDFNSLININPDGAADFTEKILYNFGTAQKHGIFRNIPVTKTNQDNKVFKMQFTDISVLNGTNTPVPFTTSISNNLLTIKIGDANKLISGENLYDIRYKVSGALTYFTDHDELYWNVTGNQWEVPIEKAESEIIIPMKTGIIGEIKADCFTGLSGETKKDCAVNVVGNKVSINTTAAFNSNEGLTVVVSFPKGLVSVLEPVEVKPVETSLVQKIISFVITLALFAGGFFWYVLYPVKIILKWLKEKKNTKSKERIVAAWFESPETLDKRSLTPAETSALVDKDVDHKDISATIIDLAQKGFIKIIVDEKKQVSLQKLIDYNESNNLTSFEKYLLNGLFSNGTLETRKLNDLKTKVSFYETIAEFKRKVSQSLVDAGLFKENPLNTATFYSVIGVVSLITFNFILAFVSFFMGRKSARRTDLGIEKYSEAMSLKNFLVSQGEQLNFQSQNQMLFEKLLPYATAFGVEKIWAKRFESLKLVQPDWYDGNITDIYALSIISSSLNNSIRSNISYMSSTRSSSGFSSGFSGGSSGGGGGGGGGGSW